MGGATGRTTAAMLVLCVCGVVRAESPLGSRFERSLQDVAGAAEKADAESVLVVVRRERGSLREKNADGLLLTIREELARQLAAHGLQPEPFDFADEKADLADGRESSTDDEDASQEAEPVLTRVASRLLSERDVARLGEEFTFDAVLGAAYRKRRGERSLRLVLLTPEERLLLTRVPLPLEGIPVAKSRSGSPGRSGSAAAAAGRSSRGNGRLPGQPRTFGGHSGFLVNRFDRDRKPTEEPGEDVEEGDGPPEEGGGATGLNKKVLDFARSNVGKQVGDGECWTLAAMALLEAGAKPAKGYVFGEAIERGQAGPGDVLQFKRAKFEWSNQYYLVGLPDHTAVVEAVKGDVVHVLHQNFGSKTVTRTELDFSTMTKGNVWAYRPVPGN